MNRGLELLAASALGAALALFIAHSGFAPDAAPQPASAPAELTLSAASADELREALEREATQREMLAAEVELMRSVLEQIAAAQVRASEVSAEEAPSLAAQPAARRPSTPGGGKFEAARLEALGLAEREIADLRERWDAAQLAKLELGDRAARQGWLMKPAHRKESAGVESEMRAELGDEAYDQLLYATNQVNRAEVKQVFGGSVAAGAGLQPGDQLISYGGERIFKPQGLRYATVTGRRDEAVVVVVRRGDETVSVVVPRGPLGVLMGEVSSPPR
jgi:hypothetical protein